MRIFLFLEFSRADLNCPKNSWFQVSALKRRRKSPITIIPVILADHILPFHWDVRLVWKQETEVFKHPLTELWLSIFLNLLGYYWVYSWWSDFSSGSFQSSVDHGFRLIPFDIWHGCSSLELTGQVILDRAGAIVQLTLISSGDIMRSKVVDF